MQVNFEESHHIGQGSELRAIEHSAASSMHLSRSQSRNSTQAQCLLSSCNTRGSTMKKFRKTAVQDQCEFKTKRTHHTQIANDPAPIHQGLPDKLFVCGRECSSMYTTRLHSTFCVNSEKKVSLSHRRQGKDSVQKDNSFTA